MPRQLTIFTDVPPIPPALAKIADAHEGLRPQER